MSVQDFIAAAQNQEPVAAREAFDAEMANRIAARISDMTPEVARGLFANAPFSEE
jgi:hypothetical protein